MRDKVADSTRLELMMEAIINIEEFLINNDSYDSFVANKVLRHVLVHDYYTVDMKTVWAIIVVDLPGLKAYTQD